MRKTILFLLLFAGLASAQVSINTNLTTGTMTSGTANIYRTAYLHFQLVNCGDNTPVMPGTTNGIVQDSFDLHPSTPGSAIVGQIVGNDQITCGNVVSSYYVLTPMKDASHPLRDGEPFVICSAAATITTCGNQASLGTFNIITADPMQQPPPVPGYVEIYGNPTNDQTINQPINGFNGWTGLSTSFTFTNGLILGPVSTAQLSSLTGYTNIVMTVDSVVGSNPCAGGGTGALAIYVGGQWNCNIGNGTSGGPGTCTQYDIAYWLAGSPSDALGCLGGISGYVPMFQTGAAPIAAPPGLVDSTTSPVSTSPYGLRCDSTVTPPLTVLDRETTIPLVSGASVVNIPLSSNAGCHGMIAILEDETGTVTFNATSPDTLTVLNGSLSTSGASSFTLTNGNWVSLNQSSAGTWTARITKASSGGSGGGNPSLDNCTPDQTGNSFYSLTTPALTNYFYASWEFIPGSASYFNCTVYIPTAQTGATIALDIVSSDATAGHTATFQTCDAVVNSGTINLGSALTCASSQTFTTTTTAYNRVTLTFNVQSTLANGSILVIKIATATSGTQPAANMLVYPHFIL
jgi:hypothetical protein